jgi:transcriptional regulator with PAS, ATPase and Fis domain
MRKGNSVIKMREQEADNVCENIKNACVTINSAPPAHSLLMPIQKTIQHFASLLANVLHLEVEVVDNQLLRIAGTGPYGQRFGQVPASNTVLLKEVMEKKQEVVIFDSRQNLLCQDCTQRESCRERGFIGVPIIHQQRCLGVISLVAVNITQLRHLREHTSMFIEYIRHISTLLAANLAVLHRKEPLLDPLLQCLAMGIDRAVILCDRQQNVVLINDRAREMIGPGEDALLWQNAVLESSPRQQTFLLRAGERRWRITGQFSEAENGAFLLPSACLPAEREGEAPEPAVPTIKNLIGESVAIRKLRRLVGRIAGSPSSVMILGESGTGKEVVARAIHRLSPRHDKAFVAINCAAIPENLLESELFGYAKGAFTGASPGGKPGLLQVANGGTLFLDEIGDMPQSLQARLLRAIESREVMPVGSSVPVPVDIRIISATHQNLEAHIREGHFREDLFYRLNVIPLWLPPLREREGDVELLINHFMAWHARRIGRRWAGVSPEVMKMLCAHSWPGNVRELSNLVEYLINIVPEGEVIDSALLPPVFHSHYFHAPAPKEPGEGSTCVTTVADNAQSNLKSVERTLIEEALQRTRNKKQVADELGIGVATLYRKIKKYGLA